LKSAREGLPAGHAFLTRTLAGAKGKKKACGVNHLPLEIERPILKVEGRLSSEDRRRSGGREFAYVP